MQILIVDDNELISQGIASHLGREGRITCASSLQEGMAILQEKTFQLIFVDLNLEFPLAGFELIKEAKRKNLYCVVLSGHEEDEIVRDAYLCGANDYFVKDGNLEGLDQVIKAYHYNTRLKDSFPVLINEQFVTQDQKLIEDIRFVLQDPRDRALFISGPSGIGKSRVAQLIHEHTKGSSRPFVHLNCSSFSESLLESELFGHVKGAFTGAAQSKKGKLELADGGTIFLDEISTMSLSVQTKLLVALENKEFYPVGGEKPIRSQFRIVSATWEDMGRLIQSGAFRFDLYSRIHDQKLHLPALEERPEDIPLLVHFFLKGKRKILFGPGAMEKMKRYHWPGNIRELRNCVESLIPIPQGIVRESDLPFSTPESGRNTDQLLTPVQIEVIKRYGLKYFIKKIQSDAGEIFLKMHGGNKTAALKELQVSKSLFYENHLPPNNAQRGELHDTI